MSETKAYGMDDLVGERCRIEFDLPVGEWPISGFPAWGYVEDVDHHHIKLNGTQYGEGEWIKKELIKRIRTSP